MAQRDRDTVPVPLSGTDRHRQFGNIRPAKKSWLTKLNRLWENHKSSIIIFAIIVGGTVMAIQQIRNDRENTARAEKQGNVLTMPTIK